MELEFQPFRDEHYQEYASWFADAELNRRLGPIDQEWLEAVLDEGPSNNTWVIFRDEEMVALVETTVDWPQKTAFITGLAVRPSLRRQGIGRAVLRHLLHQHESRGIRKHVTFIALDNEAARRGAQPLGFVEAGEPNENGYQKFQRLAALADSK